MSTDAPREESTAYNAQVIHDLERELMSPWQRERFEKQPQWVRLLINSLIKRIANLRAALAGAQAAGAHVWPEEYAETWNEGFAAGRGEPPGGHNENGGRCRDCADSDGFCCNDSRGPNCGFSKGHPLYRSEPFRPPRRQGRQARRKWRELLRANP